MNKRQVDKIVKSVIKQRGMCDHEAIDCARCMSKWIRAAIATYDPEPVEQKEQLYVCSGADEEKCPNECFSVEGKPHSHKYTCYMGCGVFPGKSACKCVPIK